VELIQPPSAKQKIANNLLIAQRGLMAASDELAKVKLATRTPEYLELQQLLVRLMNLVRNVGRLEL